VAYATNFQSDVTGVTSTPQGQASQTIVYNATKSPLGAPASLVYGNQLALTTTYGYDSRMRVSSIQTIQSVTPNTHVQDLALTYDPTGNLMQLVDNGASGGETSTYSYDYLNRLTGMSVGSMQVAAYAYDAVGNLVRKKEGQLDLTLDYDQTGQPQPHPHAVTKLKFTGTANTYKALSYDANGSLAAASASVGGAQQDGFAFDAENRLKTRSSGLGPASVTTEYVYDGSGALVKKTTPAPPPPRRSSTSRTATRRT